MAEKVSDIVINIRDYYERHYGGLESWDEFTDDVFFMNCDVNIEAEIARQGGYLHPKSQLYGPSRGVMAVHFDPSSFYSIVENAEEPLTYDKKERAYERMVTNIANFLFEFANVDFTES